MGTAFSIAFAPLVSSRTCLVWFLFKHWPVEKGPRAPLSDHPTYNKKMSVGITQASSGHDCFRLLGAVNLLPFMQIQRSLRLALVCRKWVTAVLALAIHHVLSNQGLILSTCSFMKSLQKKKKKCGICLPQVNGAVCGLVRPQDHRVNRCPFQNLNPRKAIYWPLKAIRISSINFSRQSCVFDLFWSLPASCAK